MALLAGAGLLAGLTACGAFLPNGSSAQDVSRALGAADIGVEETEVSFSLDGFTKHASVWVTFDHEMLSAEELRTTLLLVQKHLRSPGVNDVELSFFWQRLERMSIGDAVNQVNREIEAAGLPQLDASGDMLIFTPQELGDLVRLWK